MVSCVNKLKKRDSNTEQGKGLCRDAAWLRMLKSRRKGAAFPKLLKYPQYLNTNLRRKGPNNGGAYWIGILKYFFLWNPRVFDCLKFIRILRYSIGISNYICYKIWRYSIKILNYTLKSDGIQLSFWEWVTDLSIFDVYNFFRDNW